MVDLSNVKVTEELMKKVTECETADELMELARDSGAELTQEEAEECLQELSRKLTDEELDAVAGGEAMWECKYCAMDYQCAYLKPTSYNRSK